MTCHSQIGVQTKIKLNCSNNLVLDFVLDSVLGVNTTCVVSSVSVLHKTYSAQIVQTFILFPKWLQFLQMLWLTDVGRTT